MATVWLLLVALVNKVTQAALAAILLPVPIMVAELVTPATAAEIASRPTGKPAHRVLSV